MASIDPGFFHEKREVEGGLAREIGGPAPHGYRVDQGKDFI